METKIFNLSKQENNLGGIERIAKFLELNSTKSELMSFLKIDIKFSSEYTHELLIQKVLDTKKWQDIMDMWDIENIGICSSCGEPLIEGVFANGDYYCCKNCLEVGLGIETYYKLNLEEEDDYFWTEL